MAEKPTIIVKKYKKAGHGYHGGAWKIAYADFVTAMMAFFLLMWLVNSATEEAKKGVAEYFTATVVTSVAASTGTGMMGGEVIDTQSGNSELEVINDEENKYNFYNSNIPNNENQLAHEKKLFPNDYASNETGAKKANLSNQGKGTIANQSPKTTVTKEANPQNKLDSNQEKEIKGPKEEKQETTQDKKQQDKSAVTKEENSQNKLDSTNEEEKKQEAEQNKKQQDKAESLQKIMDNLKQAFNSLEELEKFKHNLIIELTEEGVKIQIIDSSEQEMFKSGSPKPVKYTENVIKAVGKIVSDLPNKINITGHTDSTPYNKKGYSNWELSSDRANATRRILESCNIDGDRFLEVSGKADRDLFNKEDTQAPENRRISITVLYPELQEPDQEDPKDNSVNSKKNEAELL